MDIDLSRPLLKVTRESERAVSPAETVETARVGAQRIGIKLEARVVNTFDFFYTSELICDYQTALPDFAQGVRIAGKGPSEAQCLASCFMEFVERASLYRYCDQKKPEHICFDLKENRPYRLGPTDEFINTRCAAAGNNYEEAILHALQELVETRIANSCYFIPHKAVSFDSLPTPYPDWVKRNFLIIKTPSDTPMLHHVTVMQYPSDRIMDIRTSDRVFKVDDRVFFSRHRRPLNHHSPASGSAAGLNIDACIRRAAGEVFQGTGGRLGDSRRRLIPEGIPFAMPEDLVDHETDSITADIQLILELLGEDTFVGVVDVSDPVMKIPVVKLFSDYDPKHSLMSSRVLDRFFEND